MSTQVDTSVDLRPGASCGPRVSHKNLGPELPGLLWLPPQPWVAETVRCCGLIVIPPKVSEQWTGMRCCTPGLITHTSLHH